MSDTMLFTNKLFSDVFPTSDTFIAYFKTTPFYAIPVSTMLTDTTLELIYILLYNKYGNNEIINFSENQFKSKLCGIVWAVGPVWLTKLKIQEKLWSLGINDDSEIFKGSTAFYNHAMHDETAPSTLTTEELPYINDQNVTKYKKSKLEGLMMYADTLNDRITDDFINKFRRLFKTFLPKYANDIYITPDDEE